MKKIIIALIRFYQRYISPMKSTRCPYVPCCSQYGLEAVEKYGAFRGGLMAAWRIVRCNPLSRGGYDPVPKMKYSVNRTERNQEDNIQT